MVSRVAVVGPGLMGLGIAQVVAAAGLEVVLMGRDAAAARAGRDRLAAQLARQVARGRMTDAAAGELMSRVHADDGNNGSGSNTGIGAGTGNDSALAKCDLAIESVPEDRDLKLAVLQRLQSALPAGAWIATNTSGLPIGGLASALQRPERFLGLHFFSPVERMPLVEVVRGPATDEATLREALNFVSAIGQTPIVVRDGPGFFTSRVFAAYLDEALAMVGEGVHPATIEQAGVALGRPIGPLAVLDEVSLRLNLQQARQARRDGLDPRFCRTLAEPVLARMVDQGRGGRRDGGGFYDHGAPTGRSLWPGLAQVYARAVRQPPLNIVSRRLRCAEAMEALRCLEEGVITSADDADTGSLLGLGFPPASGGLLRWAETEGLGRIVDHCAALARDHGPRFEPSPWLRTLADSGRGLAAWRQHRLTGDTE